MDTIITGASRGIGRALALRLSRAGGAGDRLFVVARDEGRLQALAAEAGPRVEVVVITGDLSRIGRAHELGERLAAEVKPGATLVHNAGVWPTRLELSDGLEVGFATNCVCPLVLERPLLSANKLARVLVVGAGLMALGRFRADKTPTGGDFSSLRTYASTKLAGAIALRDEARRHPEVDVAIVHPGVVNTDLGAQRGLLGKLLPLGKRFLETPERCAERLSRLLARPRFEHVPGEAPWFFEEREMPYPAAVNRDEAAVLEALARLPLPPQNGSKQS